MAVVGACQDMREKGKVSLAEVVGRSERDELPEAGSPGHGDGVCENGRERNYKLDEAISGVDDGEEATRANIL